MERKSEQPTFLDATALVGRAAYEAAYPGCHWLNGDLDGDGNVTFDDISGFSSIISSGNGAGPAITYAWDAENRLIEVRPTFPAVTQDPLRVVFDYDYMGRRVRKRVYDWVTSGGGAWSTTATLDRRFVYDGWLLLMELDGLSTPTPNAIIRQYTWGLDLSGLNGNPSDAGIRDAGGIGGLLACYDTNGGTSTTSDDRSYWHCYDGNGNVGQLLDPADDSGLSPPQAWATARLAAAYEYDPYGGITAQAGSYADANPFRFSTNQYEPEIDLVNGKARYYSPRLGRWLNRDPYEDRGGVNIYSFVLNDPIRLIDAIGLAPTITWKHRVAKASIAKSVDAAFTVIVNDRCCQCDRIKSLSHNPCRPEGDVCAGQV